jgi:hypothetical protein
MQGTQIRCAENERPRRKPTPTLIIVASLTVGGKKKASDRPRPKRTEEHRQCHIHGLTQTDIYLVFEIHPAVEDAVIHMLVGLVQAMAFGLTSNMYR